MVALARVLGVLAATCWCASEKLIPAWSTTTVLASVSLPAVALAVISLVSLLKGGRDAR